MYRRRKARQPGCFRTLGNSRRISWIIKNVNGSDSGSAITDPWRARPMGAGASPIQDGSGTPDVPSCYRWAMVLLLASLTAAASPKGTPPAPPLPVDRTWQVLREGPSTARFAKAAELLGDWEIELAGVPVSGPTLLPFATPGVEPLDRLVRETLARPVDVEDLLYFLDDVLRAEDRRGERFHVHTGRARAAGILVHPDDVFGGGPRQYPNKPTLPVDPPAPQPPPEVAAADGDPPGPPWTARFQNPSEKEPLLEVLAAERPTADFAERVRSLLDQLEASGAEVYLASTSRSRERGYLMWGAFTLGKATSAGEVERRAKLLDARNTEWGLAVPITWRHPDGWEATVEGARQMADSYDVVYATEKGARESNHYGGTAADLIAIALPRRVTLTAPDGATRSFDLSDPSEPRDLSVTPRMIDWIEQHFGFRKLRSDHPHWDDAVPTPEPAAP